MTVWQPVAGADIPLDRLTADFVLGVSPSMKPAPGQTTPSATRSVLGGAFATLAKIYPSLAIVDLRQSPVPLFDGRGPQEHNDPSVIAIHDTFARSGALYFAIPAYWRAVSGSFKNLIELMSGANYDGSPAATVFHEKPVGFFVIGADRQSAIAGAEQARGIFEAVGARLVGTPIVAGTQDGLDLVRLGQQVVADAGAVIASVLNGSRETRVVAPR